MRDNLIVEGSNHSDDFEWECLCDAITEAMNKVQGYIPEKDKIYYSGLWHVEVNSFGWMEQNGYNIFKADDGETLLFHILPHTDCTFWLHENGEYNLRLRNAHHDSPMGKENYYISPCSDNDYLLFIVNGDGGFSVKQSQYFRDFVLKELLLENHEIAEMKTEEDYQVCLAQMLSGEEFEIDFMEFAENNVVKVNLPFVPTNSYKIQNTCQEVYNKIFQGEEVIFKVA